MFAWWPSVSCALHQPGENLWTLEGGDGSWATSGMGVAVFVGPEPVEDWIIFEGFEPGRRTYPAGQGA